MHFRYDPLEYLCTGWGTGMMASSSTFRPHTGRVIRDLFRLLHAVRHGMEAPVYSNHTRKLQRPRIWPYSSDGLPVAYLCFSAQQRSQCSTRINAGTFVGCGSLK